MAKEFLGTVWTCASIRTMKLSKFLHCGLAILSILPALAQLPALQEKPWLGHFVGYERRDFTCGIKEDGKMVLEAKNAKGSVLGFQKSLTISAEIVETVSGKQIVKQVIPESLTSADKPTEDPQKITFRGKVTGDAEFEMVAEFDGDNVFVGGRMLNAGTLTNPLHFQIRVRFGDIYRNVVEEKLEDDAKKDRIEFVRLDKKKGKCGVLESIDLAAADITGAGLSAVSVELSCYDERKFEYLLQGDGQLLLENPRGIASLPKDGFSILWRGDTQKDKDGKGRLHMKIK